MVNCAIPNNLKIVNCSLKDNPFISIFDVWLQPELTHVENWCTLFDDDLVRYNVIWTDKFTNSKKRSV